VFYRILQLSTADLQPQAFYQRLQALKTYAAAMPGNAAVPNDETLRLTFFNSMPHAAKERFGEMHGLPSNMATPELIRFMERQMRYSSRPSSNGNHGNGNHGNGNNNYGNNNNGNHGNRRNNGDWNRQGNQSRRDQCPLHPGASHSFSECFANPRNTKYDADFAARLHARSTQRDDRPLLLLDRAPILIKDLATLPATIGRRLMRTSLRPAVPLTLSQQPTPT
jgi:hypothetical protein